MTEQQYFRDNLAKYRQAVAHSQDLYRKSSRLIAPFLRGKVLDLGNGGIIDYPLERVEKLVCQDLVFTGRELSGDKVDCLFGDFYDYQPLFQPDVVIARFLLHHLLDEPGLLRSLRVLGQNMPPEGRLLVVEVELPESARFLQAAVAPLLNAGLKWAGKPGVRFFSAKSLARLLRQAGFRVLSRQGFRLAGTVSPAPVILPALRIPGRLYPFRMMLVEAGPIAP